METILISPNRPSKKRIILFTQWFEPEPTFKGLFFAHELQNRGYEVHVVTGFPNYPGGKLYSGYHVRMYQHELINGIEVHRLPLYPSHDRSSVRRILNYFSFCFSLIIFGVLFMPNAQVIYAYHPPITVGIAAVIIRLVRRIPVVYDIQDLWPDTLLATNMITNRKIISLIGYMCKFVYHFVDHIVVLSPGFKKILIQRNVPETKLSVIYNWANESNNKSSVANSLSHLPKSLLDLSNNFVILFAGNVGKAQGLETVIKSAEITLSRSSNIRWVIVGSGLEYENIKSLIDSKRLSNILILPRVPMKEINAYLDYADVLLVHLRDEPLFDITIPSKIQAYMQAGRPLLAALRGDAASLVSEAQCGLVVSPEDPNSLADAAEQLSLMPSSQLSIMSSNAKEYYNTNLSLAAGVDRFKVVFDSLNI